jgi:hypothetical protein
MLRLTIRKAEVVLLEQNFLFDDKLTKLVEVGLINNSKLLVNLLSETFGLFD